MLDTAPIQRAGLLNSKQCGAKKILDKHFFRFGKRDAALKSAFTRFARKHPGAAVARLIKMAMESGLKSGGCYGKRELS